MRSSALTAVAVYASDANPTLDILRTSFISTQMTRYTKKYIIFSFALGIVFFVLLMVTIAAARRSGITPMMCCTVMMTIMCIFFLCLMLSATLPVKPGKTGIVCGEFSEDTTSVSIGVSKYVFNRRPFRIFVDGKKAARIYPGEELRIPIPEGRHEISASFSERLGMVGATIDIRDGMELFIWYDRKVSRWQPLQIAPVFGDKTALDERSKIHRRWSIRVFGLLAVLYVALAALYWVDSFL